MLNYFKHLSKPRYMIIIIHARFRSRQLRFSRIIIVVYNSFFSSGASRGYLSPGWALRGGARIELSYQFLCRICGPCTCHMRVWAHHGHHGSHARVSWFWFLAERDSPTECCGVAVKVGRRRCSCNRGNLYDGAFNRSIKIVLEQRMRPKRSEPYARYGQSLFRQAKASHVHRFLNITNMNQTKSFDIILLTIFAALGFKLRSAMISWDRCLFIARDNFVRSISIYGSPYNPRTVDMFNG